MSLFDRPVYCDECGAQFVVDDSRIGSIKKDDLEVQYLSCPSCGAKFLIFVSDSKMRSPVKLRWIPSYDSTVDKIIPEGEPQCPACGQMPYSTERCIFCGQKFLKEDT